jgi:DNA-binding IclR family transcriptional regulator
MLMEDKALSAPQEGAAAAAKRHGVNALERGLRLLMVVNTPGGLTLSESARRAGLNKTTALRLFRSLERMAFVQRQKDRYSPGSAVAALQADGTPLALGVSADARRLSPLVV